MKKKPTPFEIERPFGDHVQCIRIGKRFFHAEKETVHERMELLCKKRFRQRERDYHGGDIIHFDYSGHFKLRDKPLLVSARLHTGRAPYGSRMHVKARYDGNCIGDYGMLRSTIGAGSNGNWPGIKNNEWELLISLDASADANGYMHFSVEYFENLFPEKTAAKEAKTEPVRIKANKIPAGLHEYKLEPEALQPHRQTAWEKEIEATRDMPAVRLSCARYPGFARFMVVSRNIFFDKKVKAFLGKSVEGCSDLHVIEFACEGETQYFFPWHNVVVVAPMDDSQFVQQDWSLDGEYLNSR